jgi:hypothetical protein
MLNEDFKGFVSAMLCVVILICSVGVCVVLGAAVIRLLQLMFGI